MEVIPCITSCGLDTLGLAHPHLGLDGGESPTVLVIGEAPGAKEDELGHLFVGDSGQLLRKVMIDDAGIPIETVAFVNVLGCRPPDNATPTPSQIRCCLPRLEQAIASVQDSCKLILLMGATATSTVLGLNGISKYHGQIFQRNGIWVVPCYHPAYILREADALSAFVDDIKNAWDFASRCQPESVPTIEADSQFLETHLLELLNPNGFLGYDTETAGVDPYSDDAYVICVSLSWNDTMACSVPLEHKDLQISPDEIEKRIRLLTKILESDAPKTTHNGKFDRQFLLNCLGISVNGDVSDTLNLYHLVDENCEHSLSAATRRYLPTLSGYDDEMEVLKKQVNYRMPLIPWEKILPYSCGDALACRRLAGVIQSILAENPKLHSHAYTGVVPATLVYTKMETAGVKLDRRVAARLSTEYREKRAEISASIQGMPLAQKWAETKLLEIRTSKESDATGFLATSADLAKWEAEVAANPALEKAYNFRIERARKRLEKIRAKARLNLDSPDQLHEFLYSAKYCGLPPQRNRDSNNLTSDGDARQLLLELTAGNKKYEAGRTMLEHLGDYNRVTKLGSTYADQAESWLHDDGLIHTQMKQWGTVTGRCAYEAPNLQNIPRNQADTGNPLDTWLANHNLKQMFISKFSDGVLLNMDFSQLELRIMATISQDPIMCQVYREGGDLHAQTGRLLHPDYDSVPSDVQKAYRSEGKTYNFASVYAMKPEYLDMYPGLKAWVEATKEFAETHGYTENPFGRRRHISELTNSRVTKYERSHALKQAVNFVIQSTGHEMLLYALAKIDREMTARELDSHLIFEVHDSLVLDCTKPELAEVVDICRTAMQDTSAYSWVTIPILVDASFGPNWEQQEGIH